MVGIVKYAFDLRSAWNYISSILSFLTLFFRSKLIFLCLLVKGQFPTKVLKNFNRTNEQRALKKDQNEKQKSERKIGNFVECPEGKKATRTRLSIVFPLENQVNGDFAENSSNLPEHKTKLMLSNSKTMVELVSVFFCMSHFLCVCVVVHSVFFYLSVSVCCAFIRIETSDNCVSSVAQRHTHTHKKAPTAMAATAAKFYGKIDGEMVSHTSRGSVAIATETYTTDWHI